MYKFSVLSAVLFISLTVPGLVSAAQDRTPPKITSLSIKSNGSDPSIASAGTGVTISLTANEKVTPLVLVESRALIARGTNTGGNSWSNAYTVEQRDPTGKLDYLITLTDTSGNTYICTSAKLIFQIIPRCLTTDNTSVTIVKNVPPAPDTQAPVIASHENISVAGTLSGATVTYTSPTATDNVDTNVSVMCGPASGANFPVGDTTVTCIASDTAGNAATPTTFTVTVTLPPPSLVFQHWPSELGATSTAPSLTVNVLNNSAGNAMAMYKPTATTSVSSVCFAIDSYEATDTNLRLGIYEASQTDTGALIGQSDPYPFAGQYVDWYFSGQTTCFTFPTPVTLSAGSYYAFAVNRLLNSSNSQDILWYNKQGGSNPALYTANSTSLPGSVSATSDTPYIKVYGVQ